MLRSARITAVPKAIFFMGIPLKTPGTPKIKESDSDSLVLKRHTVPLFCTANLLTL
jgi:hypothetical protein